MLHHDLADVSQCDIEDAHFDRLKFMAEQNEKEDKRPILLRWQILLTAENISFNYSKRFELCGR